MARVLFAWEFGGDPGQARRILSIARELRAMGHEVAFAFRDLTPLGAAPIDGVRWFQAPWLTTPRTPNPSPANTSDILLNAGYGDTASLGEALRGWLSMLRLWTPDGIVADDAPTALLAARAARLSCVTVGSGFAIPPAADPLPALRPWAPADPAALAHADNRLVTCIRDAFSRQGSVGPAPARASDVFAAKAHLLCAWPALDPFGPREGVEYLGPRAEDEPGTTARWSTAQSPRVLACLEPRDPRFRAILAALDDAAAEAIVTAPGLSPHDAAALSTSRVRLHPGALALAGLLDEATLCVSHAEPGFAARALARGVPLALLPMQLEEYRVGLRLRDLGVAELLSPDDATPDLARWLREVLARDPLRAAARSHAVAFAAPSASAAARISALLAA
jgi:UDP:flavonoid glycosyltransferase YjiC (YdhE family)